MNAGPHALDRWCAQQIAGGAGFDREGIVRHQMAQLRATLAWVQTHSPFYRRHMAGIDPQSLLAQEDLQRLPFTHEDDLRRNQPSLLCVSQSAISRIVTLETSGTNGNAKRLYFTADEQETTIDFFAHGMAQLVERGDRVLILFPCTRPGGVGRLLATALERLGARPILAGPIADMNAALEQLASTRPQVVAGLPLQVRALARCSRLHRILSGSIRSVLISADQIAPQLRRDISDDWGCEVFEHWGMTETGLGAAVECRAHQGYHIRENDLLVEIVDPKSGRPLQEGEYGEVVISTLTRRGMPLIRYRTGDLSRLLPGPCACGSPLRRLGPVEREQLTRVALLPGVHLTLSALDSVLFTLPALTDYSVTLRQGTPPCLQLALAHAGGPHDAPGALAQVESLLRQIAAIRTACTEVGLHIALTHVEGPLCARTAKRRFEVIDP